MKYSDDESEKELSHDSLFSPTPKLINDEVLKSSQNSQTYKIIFIYREDEDEEDDISDALLHYISPHPPSYFSYDFDPYIFIKHLPPYNEVVTKKLPFVLPEKSDKNSKTHTLVLDLDETLVHCSIEPIPSPDLKFPVNYNGLDYTVYVKIRPHFQHFIDTVSKYYEVVVFTASQRVYAEKLLDSLDPDHIKINHRLYRNACICVDGNYIKDLNVLGRDIEKCVIIDNSPHAFGYQLDNGIPIESWFDDPKDNELLTLLPFLIKLSSADNVKIEIRNRYKLYQLVS